MYVEQNFEKDKEQAYSLLRGLISGALDEKDDNIEKALLTCRFFVPNAFQKLPRESGLLQQRFNKYFGIFDIELDQLIEEISARSNTENGKIKAPKSEIKFQYNGYLMGTNYEGEDLHCYSPYTIFHYLQTNLLLNFIPNSDEIREVLAPVLYSREMRANIETLLGEVKYFLVL